MPMPEKRDDDLAASGRTEVDTVRAGRLHLKPLQAAASVQIPGMRTAVEPVATGAGYRVMQRVQNARLNLYCCLIPANPAFRGEEQDLQEMLET